MAQIDLSKIKRVDKQRNLVHSKVLSTYCVFENCGAKYIQIDTYGNNDREMPEKISQSLQLTKATAKFLVNLLTKEFDLKQEK